MTPDDIGRLVDHHCHGIVTGDLDRPAFEALLNEAAGPSPLATTLFDSMLGLAVRRHCAPVLGLDPLVPAEEYLAQRTRLGGAESSRRLMAAAGIQTLLVDTGIATAELTSPGQLAALCGGTAHEVVRLERLAEEVLAGPSDDFAGEVTQRLRESGAVAAKSIAAYRVGLGLPAARPSQDELIAALDGADPGRLADPTVSGWLAHTAVELGLPLQIHAGYGDSDLDLLACDPLRLTPFLRSTQGRGVPVLLLHNYPYHRQAAYLAQVFDHVFLDLSLATHSTGALSVTLLREALELAPFGKLLFATDAYGLAELYLLGAHLFRTGLSELLTTLVRNGEMTDADAIRVAGLVGRENARRAYRL